MIDTSKLRQRWSVMLGTDVYTDIHDLCSELDSLRAELARVKAENVRLTSDAHNTITLAQSIERDWPTLKNEWQGTIDRLMADCEKLTAERDAARDCVYYADRFIVEPDGGERWMELKRMAGIE